VQPVDRTALAASSAATYSAREPRLLRRVNRRRCRLSAKTRRRSRAREDNRRPQSGTNNCRGELARRLLLAFLFACNIAGSIWKKPDSSQRGKTLSTIVVMALIGLAGCLVAFKVHWYPATDGSGPPP
jgi:hypothetical protein